MPFFRLLPATRRWQAAGAGGGLSACRIEAGRVYCHEQAHASATIGRPDLPTGFGFSRHGVSALPLAGFVAGAARPKSRPCGQASGLGLSERTGRPDVIHCSAIPWVRFTGLTHARSFQAPRQRASKSPSARCTADGASPAHGRGVNVHHGLADGYHVGLFLEHLPATARRG
ncbi:MAG: hypothetical protein WKG07_11755 [Hymenobacter sp.]